MMVFNESDWISLLYIEQSISTFIILVGLSNFPFGFKLPPD